MKKQSIQGGLKKAIAVTAISTGLLLVNAATSNAATLKDSVTTTEKANYVQYVSATEDGVWFNIRYANPTGEKFTLLIKNSDGDLLYQGSFSSSNFEKKIKVLNEEDNETLTPTFIIKTADNKRISQSFQVNTTLHMVQEVIVTKS